MPRSRRFFLPISLAFFGIVCCGVGCTARRYKPYLAQITPAQPLHIPGMRDAAKVTDFLYHGSQPNREGIEQLHALGITTIIDLRGERKRLLKKESREAELLGMKVVNIPGNGWSAPKDKEVAQFLTLIHDRGKQRFFVHCWLGDDRSGVFIAAYRIVFDRWTPQQAVAEMYYFHYKGFWHPVMRKYVLSLPDRLAHSPPFARFREAALANSRPASAPSP